jgi:hypothetical protein
MAGRKILLGRHIVHGIMHYIIGGRGIHAGVRRILVVDIVDILYPGGNRYMQRLCRCEAFWRVCIRVVIVIHYIHVFQFRSHKGLLDPSTWIFDRKNVSRYILEDRGLYGGLTGYLRRLRCDILF